MNAAWTKYRNALRKHSAKTGRKWPLRVVRDALRPRMPRTFPKWCCGVHSALEPTGRAGWRETRASLRDVPKGDVMSKEYRLTPTEVDGKPHPNPLAYVMEEGEHDSRALLADGVYQPPGLVKRMRPSIVKGESEDPEKVIIDPGAQGGNALSFAYAECSNIMFESITGMCGHGSAVLASWMNKPWTYPGLEFANFVVDGGWDHEQKKGRRSKWGMRLHRIGGFSFQGTIRDVFEEHGGYISDTDGAPVFFYKTLITRCNTTGLQMTGRVNESGEEPSLAELRLRDVEVRDCTIGGASAITISGQAAPAFLERVRISFPNMGSGGGFLSWAEREIGNPDKPGTPNTGGIGIVDCEFLGNKTNTTREIVRASACPRFHMAGTIVRAGLNPTAVHLNPPESSMASDLWPVVVEKPSKPNVIDGRVLVHGFEIPSL